MTHRLHALRSVLFGRETAAAFLALWIAAVGGFAWLASGLWMPTRLAAAFDLVFVKLLALPGLLLASVLPEPLAGSAAGVVLALSAGYFVAAVFVGAAFRGARRAVRTTA